MGGGKLLKSEFSLSRLQTAADKNIVSCAENQHSSVECTYLKLLDKECKVLKVVYLDALVPEAITIWCHVMI